MFPLPLFSHTNGIMPVIRELAIRGHNVTLYSPYTEASTIGNLTEVKVNCDIGDILGKYKSFQMYFFTSTQLTA